MLQTSEVAKKVLAFISEKFILVHAELNSDELKHGFESNIVPCMLYGKQPQKLLLFQETKTALPLVFQNNDQTHKKMVAVRVAAGLQDGWGLKEGPFAKIQEKFPLILMAFSLQLECSVSAENAKESDGRSKLGLGRSEFFLHRKKQIWPGAQLSVYCSVLSVSVNSFGLFLYSSSQRKKTPLYANCTSSDTSNEKKNPNISLKSDQVLPE